MLGFSRKWIIALLFVAVVKVLLAVIASPGYDFSNNVYGAESAFTTLREGRLPFPYGGPYAGLMTFLAPFFALWMILPVAHPAVSEIITRSYHFVASPEGWLLIFVMKLPILVFDLLAGILIFFLVRWSTNSTQNAGKAFMVWYLNPYNVYMIEIWGSFDIVPAAVVLLAVICGYKKQWIATGLTLFVATALRLFPILLLPVFVLCSSKEGRQATLKLAFSFLTPLGCAFIYSVYQLGSLEALLAFAMKTAAEQPWLLDFYGIPITSAPLQLALFLYPVQLYIMVRSWKAESMSLTNLALAFLLVHFSSALHEPYHFTWVTPLLIAQYGIDQDRPTLLTLLFVSALLSVFGVLGVSTIGGFFGVPATLSDLNTTTRFFEPFFSALFYGMKAVFLIKLNLRALRIYLPSAAAQLVNSVHPIGQHPRTQ
jgi:hypothetical protein